MSRTQQTSCTIVNFIGIRLGSENLVLPMHMSYIFIYIYIHISYMYIYIYMCNSVLSHTCVCVVRHLSKCSEEISMMEGAMVDVTSSNIDPTFQGFTPSEAHN